MGTISQETFNSAVRENMEIFGMTAADSVREAILQFEKQGVDLTHITKELQIVTGEIENIDSDLTKLAELSKSKTSPEITENILKELRIIKTYCDKGLHHRVSAGKAGAYKILINILSRVDCDMTVRKNCIRTLTSLMVKQPDLLDDKGIECIMLNVQEFDDNDLKRLTWKWARECCLLHEINRQKLVKIGIVDCISDTLKNGHYEVLRETLSVCRALVLDDDVRVQFGKSHEHARILAIETLCHLVALLNRYKHDESLINDIVMTFSSLLVRTEFCEKVENAGGLEQVGEILKNFQHNDKIVKNSFKFFKSMAGNDVCKTLIIKKKLAPVLAEALNVNRENASTTIAGLSCVAALTLRSPENSKAFFEVDIPVIIYDIMTFHSKDKEIQKTASWAIRNMVSRCREQSKAFLSLGVEQILKNNLKQFKDIEYDTKAALRDLGCRVELKEEWTGKGGLLNTGTTSSKKS